MMVHDMHAIDRWFRAASEIQWAISSITDEGDQIVISAVRWTDRAADAGKHSTVVVHKVANFDTMLAAFQTLLRMEGA